MSDRFFIDENLSPALARGMAAFGEDVVHLQDHFAAGTKDETWLAEVGANRWVLVTRDDRIRNRPAELAAYRTHGVGSFILGGKNRTRCQLIQQLVRNWSRMKELARETARPFMFRVPPKGTKLVRVAL